jgi:hypothetical protein
MRPLVLLLALVALLLPACQSGSGPSSALEVQPAVGAGARVFAGPEDGVGAAARLDLGKYGFRTGKAAEPAPAAAPSATPEACPGGTCPVPKLDPLRVPEAPAPDAGRRP